MFNTEKLLELDERLRNEELKRDFSKFVKWAWDILEPGTVYKHNWHIDLICEYLEAVTKGKIRRLIVNMPPRHMKSLLISVMYPAWLWINDPTQNILLASYNHDISKDLSIKRRALIKSDAFQKAFGHIFQLSKDQNTTEKYANDKTGVMYTAATNTSATGRGGNTIILDDPHNPEQAHSEARRGDAIRFFKGTLSSRLDDKSVGRFIIVMQRLHEDDLSGHLLAEGGWKHLNLPAICEERTVIKAPLTKRRFVREPNELLWPEREGPKEIAQTKKDMGSYVFSAQYQQRPSPAEGGIIKKVYFNFYQKLPINVGTQLQSWDCNLKEMRRNDYACGQVWGKKGSSYYLIDMILDNMKVASIIRCIKDWHKKYRSAVTKLIEAKANGPAVISTIQDEIDGIIPVDPGDSKIARVHAVLPMFQSRNVHLPCYSDPSEWNETEINGRTIEMFNAIDKPEWVEKFIDSCAKFPTNTYDDDVDAMTQGLLHIRNMVDTSNDYLNIKLRAARKVPTRGRRRYGEDVFADFG